MALKDDLAKIVGEENVSDVKKRPASNTHVTTVSYRRGSLMLWRTRRNRRK